ncbi:MAG: type III-B CRISPR module RAMP protein Cmr1 [Acidobacteriota bacterium]
MPWTTYRIQFLTPTFLAGADPQQTEIRVPSIRGQLRWWFRALGGNRGEEKSLFGGVHNGAQRSRVRLRILDPLISRESRNLFDLVGTNMNQPQAYLLWPLRPTKTSEQKRGVIMPGGTFSLSVFLGPGVDHSLERKFWAALDAWILLGALGTRSRRGYGSVGPAAEKSRFPESLDSLRAWPKVLAETLSPFRSASLKAMTLGQGENDPDGALDCLGRWLKGFRATRFIAKPKKWALNDHNAALGEGEVLYRPVIGLPLEQRYQRGKRVVETKAKDCARWASPVHLKVIRAGRRYYPLAVFFPDMAIPEGSTLVLEEKGMGPRKQRTRKRADWGLFREMMQPGADSKVLWDSPGKSGDGPHFGVRQ